MLDLAPEIENTVREFAQKKGLSANDYVAYLLKTAPAPASRTQQIPRDYTDDEKRAKVLEYIRLSKEEAIQRNAPSVAHLSAELAEAESATPEEVAEAEAEWLTHKLSMNENRRVTGEALLYAEKPKGAMAVLLEQWNDKEANMTEAEKQEEQQFWDDFTEGIDESRAAQGMRKLF